MTDKSPERPRRFSVYCLFSTTTLWTLAAAQGAPLGAELAQPDGLTAGTVFGVGRLAVLALLLLVAAFLTASETAFNALGEWRLKHLNGDGGERNAAFALLERNPERFTATLLVGKTLASVAAVALLVRAALELASRHAYPAPWALAYAIGAAALLLLLLTEIVPRSIVARHAPTVAKAVIRPLFLLSVVLYPIGFVFTWLTGRLLRLLGIRPDAGAQMSEGELAQVLQSAEESGVIEAHERQMIRGVIDLEETVVREVMTPRVDVIGISEDANLLELLRLVREHGYSRLPVYSETIDNVRGVVFARDLLAYLERAESLTTTHVADLMTSVQYVPETLSVVSLLRDMRIRKSHIAVVVDEFGGTSGIVTLEDIIEEITGEIYDETDEDEEDEVVALDDGGYRLLGTAHLETVAGALHLEFDEDGDYDTLAGFMIDELGHIPAVGETVLKNGVRFAVERSDGRRVISVLATVEESEAEPGREPTGEAAANAPVASGAERG